MLKPSWLPIVIAIAVPIVTSSNVARAQNDNGETVFKKCRACHLVGAAAKHTVGPSLNGVLGRKAGAAEGYGYSPNMVELGQNGLVWTEEALDRYLENPKIVVPKGKMAFPGLKEAQDRRDVIAYLKSASGR